MPFAIRYGSPTVIVSKSSSRSVLYSIPCFAISISIASFRWAIFVCSSSSSVICKVICASNKSFETRMVNILDSSPISTSVVTFSSKAARRALNFVIFKRGSFATTSSLKSPKL